MKRTFLVLFLIFSLGLLPLLSGFKIFVKANPKIWTVDDDKPADFKTIQEALENSSVSEGDIIFVYAGVYRERPVVNKTVSLIGEDVDLTIVDGNNTGSVFYINASNVKISGFTIRNSGRKPYNSGVYVDHSFGNNISYNKLLNTYDAISLYFSSNNYVVGNVIYFSYYTGIVLSSSNNNMVSNNFVSSNFDGVYVYSSTGNVIASNTISYNFRYGIYFEYSGKNTVWRNTVSINGLGIHINSYSANNTFFHNNFNNTLNVLSSAANVWDYGGEGNTWNDYAGQDLDEDGIGDTPHVIDSNNQDNYPLLGIFLTFDILFEGEIDTVCMISNSTVSDFTFELEVETANRIMSFKVNGEVGTSGFCRIKIPRNLMEPPYAVLVDDGEIVPRMLDVSNETHVCMYFTYVHNRTVTIISSEYLRLYHELLDKYNALQESFATLNYTYLELLANLTTLQSDLYALNDTYSDLFDDFVLLQLSLQTLNDTYYSLLDDYDFVSENYSQLRRDFDELSLSLQELYVLNQTYGTMLNNYYILLDNYMHLQEDFEALNSSYQEHMSDYSGHVKNVQSLVYILIATTGIFIAATVYLSKHAHSNKSIRNRDTIRT